MIVELMPGIASISGSFKEKNGRRLVFKTYRAPSTIRGAKPETRVYIMDKRERCTPITDKERAQREKFAACSRRVNQLVANTPGLSKKEAWQIVKNEPSC